MASTLDFIRYVQEQAHLGSQLTYKKMFGEYALYVDEKVVAFVCDNSVFLKPLEQTKAFSSRFPVAPPYPGAKDYIVIDELLDDPQTLQQLLLATAAALPLPKPKKPKVKKT